MAAAVSSSVATAAPRASRNSLAPADAAAGRHVAAIASGTAHVVAPATGVGKATGTSVGALTTAKATATGTTAEKATGITAEDAANARAKVTGTAAGKDAAVGTTIYVVERHAGTSLTAPIDVTAASARHGPHGLVLALAPAPTSTRRSNTFGKK